MNRPHRILFTLVPLAQLAAAFAVGIFISHSIQLRFGVLPVIAVAFSVASLVTVVFKLDRVGGLCLLLSFFWIGALLHALEIQRTNPNTLRQLLIAEAVGEREAVVLTGTLIGPPAFARDRLYLNLRVSQVKLDQGDRVVSGVVSVLAVFRNREQEQAYRQLDLRYLDSVKLSVTLRRTDQFRNPGVSTLSEFLEQKGWDAVGLMKSPGAIAKLSTTRTGPLGFLYDWRQRLQTQIDARFDPETSGVLDASLLGNRHNLTPEVTERFRSGGTFHVLVISGFHISFLGGVVFLFARRLTKNRTTQFLLSAAVIWSYSLAVGAEASVVRAALMFTFVTFAGVLFRPSSSLNSLGAAALLILIYQPRDLFDPSFQLTFLSVLGIIAVALPTIQNLSAIGKWHPTHNSPYPPRCARWIKSLSETLFWSERDWQRELKRTSHHCRLIKSRTAIWLDRMRFQPVLRYISCAMIVSLSVQVMLLPLMIVYFHRVSFSAIVLNIGVSVLLGVLSLLAAIALVLQQFSSALSEPFVLAANAVNALMVYSVEPFSRTGIDSIRLPEYSGALKLTYFLYYVPLLLLLVGLSRWEPLDRLGASVSRKSAYVTAAVFQLVLVAIILFHPWSAKHPAGRLHVEFLDVGQGDSALVTMPDGTTLLVDGGGRPNFFRSNEDHIPARELRSIGETVVSEYLWWRGLDRVDYVLATHADADHIDGLNDVVRNFSVRGAIVARAPGNNAEFARFAETLRSRNVELTTISAGDVLLLGSVSAEVLSPAAGGVLSDNDSSVVLRLVFRERAILLTGDIEKSAEARLVSSGHKVEADIVKIPHHGSRTSSTEALVGATGASFAIITVGTTSMFGHPHKEVEERWRAHGAHVLTTGRCGTISVSTDGVDLSVKTYVPC